MDICRVDLWDVRDIFQTTGWCCGFQLSINLQTRWGSWLEDFLWNLPCLMQPIYSSMYEIFTIYYTFSRNWSQMSVGIQFDTWRIWDSQSTVPWILCFIDALNSRWNCEALLYSGARGKVFQPNDCLQVRRIQDSTCRNLVWKQWSFHYCTHSWRGRGISNKQQMLLVFSVFGWIFPKKNM